LAARRWALRGQPETHRAAARIFRPTAGLARPGPRALPRWQATAPCLMRPRWKPYSRPLLCVQIKRPIDLRTSRCYSYNSARVRRMAHREKDVQDASACGLDEVQTRRSRSGGLQDGWRLRAYWKLSGVRQEHSDQLWGLPISRRGVLLGGRRQLSNR
jgi:hypothetical protein